MYLPISVSITMKRKPAVKTVTTTTTTPKPVVKTKPSEYKTKTIALSDGTQFDVPNVLVNYVWNEQQKDFVEQLPYESQRQIEAATIAHSPNYYKPKT
jgi:hypothetical protein